MLSKLIVVLLVALLSLLSLVSSQQQIMVSVKVDGEPFDVTFAPDLVTSFDVAAQLCKQNEDKFNLATLGLESCIKPLSTYFQQFVDEYNSRLSLRTSLNVDGTVFDVTYRPDLVSSQSMASRICNENGERLGVTKATLENCVDSITESLRRVETQFIRSRTITLSLNINEKQFDITFRTDLVSPSKAANDLCRGHAEEIGVTAESLPQCIAKASEFINNSIEKWIESRMISLPVKVNEVDFTINILPDLESALDAASQVCRSERLSMEADKISTCIEDVVKYIRVTYSEYILKSETPPVPPQVRNEEL